MVKPPGAVDVARKSYKGYSVRVIPYYDGVNDLSNWRLDVLSASRPRCPISPRASARNGTVFVRRRPAERDARRLPDTFFGDGF